MSKSNNFSVLASELSKEPKFKSNQIECKFLKPTPIILMILIFKTKLSFQIVKHVDKKNIFKIFIAKNSLIVKSIRLFLNIILLSASLYVHPMFLDSRWIGNLPGSCASAPTTQIIHQGIFSSPHMLCTRENSMNTHVLHSPGTSSVTVQTKTYLKSHLSISETLSDPGQLYIKLNSIFSSTYIETFKTCKQFNLISCQIFIADQIPCVFFKSPHLLNKKLYAFIHFTRTLFTKKHKYLKTFKTIRYLQILFINYVFIFISLLKSPHLLNKKLYAFIHFTRTLFTKKFKYLKTFKTIRYFQILFINYVFILISSGNFSRPLHVSINSVIMNIVLNTSSNDGI